MFNLYFALAIGDFIEYEDKTLKIYKTISSTNSHFQLEVSYKITMMTMKMLEKPQVIQEWSL